MKKYYIIILLLNLISLLSFGQIDTKGSEFWIDFHANYSTADLKIFISSETNTNATIVNSEIGFSQTVSVTAGNVTSISVPLTALLSSGGLISNNAFHIESDVEIAVYGLNYNIYSTDAYAALPVDGLGTSYRIAGYNGGQMSVIATEDNTGVEITSSAGLSVASFLLNKGEVYFYTNSAIGALVSATKPVAVFAGDKCTNFNCCACDHLIEQLPPIESYGLNFVVLPSGETDLGTGNVDYVQIIANEDGTTISTTSNGTFNMDTGDAVRYQFSIAQQITANKPVLVVQYGKGTYCGNGSMGDPMMMVIPPQDQFLKGYIVTTPLNFANHYLNIVASSYGYTGITLDGVNIPAEEFSVVGESGYYGARIEITEGNHTLLSSMPFGVFSHGINPNNSYGYAGGMSLAPVASVSTVTISPAEQTVDVGSEGSVIALVLDSDGVPMEGILVNFIISGIGDLQGGAYTNVSGKATYTYERADGGIDAIYAKVLNLTSSTASVNWYEAPRLPVVITSETENVTNSSANLNGSISDVGHEDAHQYGFCWGQSENPDLSGTFNQLGVPSGNISFSLDVSDLVAGTKYYVRAYATNTEGTSYGAQVSFTTAKNSQTITFGVLASKTYGDIPFNLSGSASSDLPLSYTSSNTEVATVFGNTVTIIGVGSTNITASQSGDANYNAATDEVQKFVVNKASQTITFGALASKTYGDTSFSLAGSASSGLTVSYTSSDPAVATVSGNTVTIVGVGSTSITAFQSGDASYNAASDVAQTLTVGAKEITITADAKTKIYGQADPGLTYKITLGSLVVGDVLTGSLSRAAGEDIGDYAISSGLANANYLITYVPANLSITPKAVTISNFSDITKMYFDASFEIDAPSSNSAGAFTYTSSNTDVATISGTTVSILSEGTTVITANQAPYSFYAGGSIAATLTVSSVDVVTKHGQNTRTKPNYVNKNGAVGGDNAVNIYGELVATKSVDIETAKYFLNASGTVTGFEDAGAIANNFGYSDYVVTSTGKNLFLSKVFSNSTMHIYQWDGGFNLIQTLTTNSTNSYFRAINFGGETVLYDGDSAYKFDDASNQFVYTGSTGGNTNTKYGVAYDGKCRVAMLNSKIDTKVYEVADPSTPHVLSNAIDIPFPDDSSDAITYTGGLKPFSFSGSEEYGLLAYSQSFWNDPIYVSRLRPGSDTFETVFSAGRQDGESHGGNAIVFSDQALAIHGNNSRSTFARMEAGSYVNLGSYSGGINGGELPVFAVGEDMYAVLPSSLGSLVYKINTNTAELKTTVTGTSSSTNTLGVAIFDGVIYLINGYTKRVYKLVIE